MSHRLVSRLALGAPLAAAAVGYWATMSPYSQLLGRFPFRAGASSGQGNRTVALTFDDGPNEPYTSEIADFLDHRGIKATFFQVGRCVERYPGTTRRLVDAGHVIGNHSYAHRFDRCWNESIILRELQLSQAVFRDNLRLEPALYRPPWLARTPATFRVLEQSGLYPVSGTFCHALEPFQPSARDIARRTLAKVRPGSIVIFHDGYDARGADRSSTVDAVKIVVDALRDDDYSFSTVDHLLGIPAYTRTSSPLRGPSSYQP